MNHFLISIENFVSVCLVLRWWK